MLRPKISGTVVLERLAKPRELDFLVLFSSSTALLGAGGYAHYAAANMFLDATAHALEYLREASGLDQLGHVGSDAPCDCGKSAQLSRESGLEPMPAADALQRAGCGAFFFFFFFFFSEPASRNGWWQTSTGACSSRFDESRRIRPLLASVGGSEAVAVERVSKSSGAAGYVAGTRSPRRLPIHASMSSPDW